MKAMIVPLLAVLGIAGCASNRISEADRLAIYKANAGAPVMQIRNSGAMGWDRIDDHHVLLHTRPRDTWLLEVSGPCLDWGSASPIMRLSSSGPYVIAKFDRILLEGSPVSCRIEEIRLVDDKAVREAENALRDQASAGT
jgi:hypothetical protein